MLLRLAMVISAALAFAPSALAKGGQYAFEGGTRAEQAQVVKALDASTFDFSLVPTTVAIHIAPGVDAHSTRGQIWLDADLLDGGSMAWGVVQHEYAHQVDFFVLDDTNRAALHAALGGDAWCVGASHARLDCESFADLVSWAYWTSPANVMRPASAADEGGQMTPSAFRNLLARLLPPAAAPVRVTAAVKPPHKG